MSYEIYKRIHSDEEYFAIWDQDRVEDITEDAKDQIYDRYVIKCQVLQRDKFQCRNKNCEKKSDTFQMHHVIHQSDGGIDSLNNCVTLCKTCHKRYHSGRDSIILGKEEYKAKNFDRIAQRLQKYEMRQFRKELRYLRPDHFGKRIPWQVVVLLLKFLETDYSQEWD